MYKDNTPTYNINRKIFNFKDFNPDDEKEELKKMKRQNKPNSDEYQKNFANGRYKYNKVTHKMDDITPGEIDDSIESIEDDMTHIKNMKISNKKMNHIKTYEGFLGLFKSKKTEEKTVDAYDIVSCFQDLIDDEHIVTSITLDTNNNNLDNYRFNKDFHVTLRPIDPKKYKYLKKLEPNKFMFKIGYNSENISNDVVKEMLLDGESKLEIFDCKATFYANCILKGPHLKNPNYNIGIFKSVDKMYNKIAEDSRIVGNIRYGFIVEVESKYNIINREKYFGEVFTSTFEEIR